MNINISTTVTRTKKIKIIPDSAVIDENLIE